MTQSDRSDIVLGILGGLGICTVLFAVARFGFGWFVPFAPPAHSVPPSIAAPAAIQRADFHGQAAPSDVRRLADWIAESGDAEGRDFVLIDKKGAHVYVFDKDARLRDSSPALLGYAVGDDTAPDIGTRPLDKVLPSEKTTPAGRFVGERGHNARNEDVVWVDYDAAVSMHRVLTSNPAEHRLERLASPTIDDNRVSFGCINLPVAFYENTIQPLFARERAIVYVLPEVKALEDVFGGLREASIAQSPRPQVAALASPAQANGR
jgi:hypothetical protein